MGETRVDLLHLLEDLRDAYPGSLEETILIEIVANALDSGARRIVLATDPTGAVLRVFDDGRGMMRSEIRRYHDLATSSKRRGRGIGFAGVGIKLGLLAAEEVLTETRHGASHLATVWRLVGAAARKRAPWQWVKPEGALNADGTVVTLRLQNPLSPLLDDAFLYGSMQDNFATLLEPEIARVLAEAYPFGVRLEVNGRLVSAAERRGERAPIVLREGRRRAPSALGFLVRHDEPLPAERRGLAVSALGKVIQRGWEWLGVQPADADRIGGVVEVPALAECLTLNKAGFLRTGARGATYLQIRRALQEAVTAQLEAWGSLRESSASPKPRVRPFERDLQTVLADLAGEYPLLLPLVDRRPGGQRRLPGAEPGQADEIHAAGAPRSAHTVTAETTSDQPDSSPKLADVSEPAASMPVAAQAATGRARGPAHYALSIRFESRPGETALGRLTDSTVWINEAHPAYRRAVVSRSEGYHFAVTVALTLAPFAAEGERTREFVASFLAQWGARK